METCANFLVSFSGDDSRLWDCQVNFIGHDSYFSAFSLKEMIYITQISNSVNANGGYPGFSCELFDCGNSMECIAVEIYFVSAGDTQNVITQFIREQRNKGISL